MAVSIHWEPFFGVRTTGITGVLFGSMSDPCLVCDLLVSSAGSSQRDRHYGAGWNPVAEHEVCP